MKRINILLFFTCIITILSFSQLKPFYSKDETIEKKLKSIEFKLSKIESKNKILGNLNLSSTSYSQYKADTAYRNADEAFFISQKSMHKIEEAQEISLRILEN